MLYAKTYFNYQPLAPYHSHERRDSLSEGKGGGRGYKKGIFWGGRRTYTSEENTDHFPVLVSRGNLLAADFGRQGELLPDCGLDGGRSGGDEISELIGCADHEGAESWW